MNVGERIRQRRKELNLTQEELGKKLGWVKSAVCKVEKEGNNITTDRIIKIANALECTPSYLMGWTVDSYDIENSIRNHNYYLQRIYEYLGYEEHYIVEVYDKLSSKGRKEMLSMIAELQKKYCITTTPEEKLEEILMDNAGL